MVSVAILIVTCSNVKTEWKSEPIDNKHVSWNGSFDNGIKKMELIYHGWKINKNENKDYEIRIRAKILYKKNNEDDTDYAKRKGSYDSSSILVMPINNIVYKLYDEDDFIIDSIDLKGEIININYKDTGTIQMKANINKNKIDKVKDCKIQILAGYRIEKKPWEEDYSIKNK
jgi:hypothetical protein